MPEINGSSPADLAAVQYALGVGVYPMNYTSDMPPAISSAWTYPDWKPLTVTLSLQNGRAYADIGVTLVALFNAKSAALTAPDQTYYVSNSGSNANTGLSAAQAFASIHRAITVAKAASYTKIKVIVAAGSYDRANNPTNGGSVVVDLDAAFLASGGRVFTGTWDNFSAPTADATYTSTYSWTLANVNRVMDRLHLDENGDYVPLTNVASAELCNITPGSWALDGGKIYVRRADGVAVTNANTRVFRSNTGNLRQTGALANMYVGGVAPGDGFDLEGGDAKGVMTIEPSAVPASRKIVAVEGVTMKYGGGFDQTGTRGLGMTGMHGLVIMSGCRSSSNVTDNFNGHNDNAPTTASQGTLVLVNCTGLKPGGEQLSCQNDTAHEDVLMVDLGGVLKDSSGGNIRNIGTSKFWGVGLSISNDKGDLNAGGSISPTAVRADDSAVIYLDACFVDQPSGYGLYASAGASIFTRNMMTPRLASAGAGTISTY